MKYWLTIAVYCAFPVVLLAQQMEDSASTQATPVIGRYTLMINVATGFYTSQDKKINNFLSKYGYTPPQRFPETFRMEVSVMPRKSQMIFTINASTVISPQDIITANFSFGAYYRLYESKNLLLAVGLSLGEEFDRIVLDKGLPPSFDSLEEVYKNTLSMHRTALVAEPEAKIFWYPLQKREFQVGLFLALGCDADFNSNWRLGYYPLNSKEFKKIRKPRDVNTTPELGAILTAGLSVCF